MFKHPCGFNFMYTSEIMTTEINICFLRNNKIELIWLRTVLSHLESKEQIRAFDVDITNCWAIKGGVVVRSGGEVQPWPSQSIADNIHSAIILIVGLC